MRHRDGTVHFSDLKYMALSPAHYRQAVTHERETTRPMRIGTLVDMLLLTEKVPIVAGATRVAPEYKRAVERNPGLEVFTLPEYEQAEKIVEAVELDSLARAFLGLDNRDRRTQVPLKWETQGVPRSTRGLDVIVGGFVVDLKVTNSTHPDRFQAHARRMFWHAQLADYREACRQNGIDVPRGFFLVGVEATAPYPVTVLHMTEAALEAGDKLISLWIETYKACAAADHWPGYVQTPVDLDVLDLESEGLVFPDSDDADAA